MPAVVNVKLEMKLCQIDIVAVHENILESGHEKTHVEGAFNSREL